MFHLITILGPTATGKTTLACHLAALLQGEIISADSRQVYRGMDLGTGKDLSDFHLKDYDVPYHLIDVVDPGYEFNVFEFQQHVARALEIVEHNGRLPILCGGSGLYLDAVLRGYQLQRVPENKVLREFFETLSMESLTRKLKSYGPVHNTTDINDRRRLIKAIEIAEHHINHPKPDFIMPRVSSINFGLHFERQQLRDRITQRLKQRLEEGMVDEVRNLLSSGLLPEQLKFYGLEYRLITQYVMGELTYNEMFELLNTAIHQFAKRQMTWFRRMENGGVRIHWINGNINLEEKLATILSFLPKT
ncbi:MAG: tRNA (adenosine(37)-N6)-dimethylallyltransferase MiaA [Bacteroidetes bacterium]|nr:tRNA (adenosine(37)-N6)-dimethylallyltransferase MiaA [Bacteroidota bacterium]